MGWRWRLGQETLGESACSVRSCGLAVLSGLPPKGKTEGNHSEARAPDVSGIEFCSENCKFCWSLTRKSWKLGRKRAVLQTVLKNMFSRRRVFSHARLPSPPPRPLQRPSVMRAPPPFCFHQASVRLSPRGEHSAVPLRVPPLPQPSSSPARKGGVEERRARWRCCGGATAALRHLRAVGEGCHAGRGADGERQGLQQRVSLP